MKAVQMSNMGVCMCSNLNFPAVMIYGNRDRRNCTELHMVRMYSWGSTSIPSANIEYLYFVLLASSWIEIMGQQTLRKYFTCLPLSIGYFETNG